MLAVNVKVSFLYVYVYVLFCVINDETYHLALLPLIQLQTKRELKESINR